MTRVRSSIFINVKTKAWYIYIPSAIKRILKDNAVDAEKDKVNVFIEDVEEKKGDIVMIVRITKK